MNTEYRNRTVNGQELYWNRERLTENSGTEKMKVKMIYI